jgi:hypothetical protein
MPNRSSCVLTLRHFRFSFFLVFVRLGFDAELPRIAESVLETETCVLSNASFGTLFFALRWQAKSKNPNPISAAFMKMA